MFKQTPVFSSYSVNDIDQARDFYQSVLGLEVEQTKEGLNLKLQGSAVFLYPKADHQPATFTVLNFLVESIDSAVEMLEERGIALERYEMGEMSADEKGIYRGKASGKGPDIAWFKDPAGNILSVIEGEE